MKRRIIKIDEKLCNGCGACASACHEGAIKMIDGVARLVREDFCDGLGDCLPSCPTGAISFEVREAPAYNEAAVKAAFGCPSACPSVIPRTNSSASESRAARGQTAQSRLMQWPCQIKLVPINAPYFENANLLVAADCTAFAYAGFHEDFMKNHITLIGCPKLDACDYSEKLEAIIKENNVRSVKVLRMEVPCCGGLESAVKRALMSSGKFIPWQVITVSTDGKILD